MKQVFRRPCLRWPGNKYSFLNEIFEMLPDSFNNYHEPFLGAGSVFYNIDFQKRAYLSDRNEDLINFYRQVKNQLPKFIDILETKKNTESYYYRERAKKYNTVIERAAQLYYLNRTCFNGIYRVNSCGEFNVPYGHRANFNLVDKDNLYFLRKKLRNVELCSGDFFGTIGNIKKGDFVFLDPPYSSDTHRSNFLMYNEVLFSWNDQIRLKEFCKILVDRKVNFMITNLYNADILSLFSTEMKLACYELERYSRVGGSMADRGTIKEYLFTNIVK